MQNEGPLILTSHYDSGDEKIPVEISIRLIKDVHRTETGYLQVMIFDIYDAKYVEELLSISSSAIAFKNFKLSGNESSQQGNTACYESKTSRSILFRHISDREIWSTPVGNLAWNHIHHSFQRVSSVDLH